MLELENETFQKPVLDSIFYLMLGILGGTTIEILGQDTKKLLISKHVIHITVIILIYFTINVTLKKPQHPFENVFTTLSIYLLFLMLVRVNRYVTIFLLLYLFIIYIYINYLNYLENNGNMLTYYNNNSSDIIMKYEIVLSIMKYLFVVILSISFLYNIISQKKQYGRAFSYTKFITGSLIKR